MAAAQREDLRAIWECTEDHWEVSTYIGPHPKYEERYGSAYFCKKVGEPEWKRLEQFPDLTMTMNCLFIVLNGSLMRKLVMMEEKAQMVKMMRLRKMGKVRKMEMMTKL